MRILLILMIIVGCSSRQILQDLGIENAKRIGADGSDKPNFYLHDYGRENGRDIAMASDGGIQLSNKQLYFLELYQQYHQLRNLVGLESNAYSNSCPAFHNELVTFKDQLVLADKSLDLSRDFRTVLKNPELLPSYPVVSLPYRGSDVFTYLFYNSSVEASEIVKEAIHNYTEVLNEELEIICHRGVSDNYFIFENYVAFAPNDSELTNDGQLLSAALRIPVFANILILDSLRSKTYFRPRFMTDTVMARASFLWFKNYLYELEKLRQHKSEFSYLNKGSARKDP